MKRKVARKQPKRAKVREYTIADLAAIGAQLNGRIRFEIIPVEMLGLRPPQTTPSPKKTKPVRSPDAPEDGRS